MQLLLSGAIARRSSQEQVSTAVISTEAVWICQVCGKKNSADDDGEGNELEHCKCCGRDREPLWLRIERHDLQLGLGTRVRLPDDPAFGTRIGVVSGIKFLNRRVELLALSSRAVSSADQNEDGRRNVKSASGRRSKLRFETVEMDVSQLQLLSPTSSATGDDVQELTAAMDQHGLCGECRRVFRILQGDLSKENVNRDAIQSLQDELRRVSELKRQNIRMRNYDRVLENTSNLKSLECQLLQQKRALEFLGSTFCPYCGWTAGQER